MLNKFFGNIEKKTGVKMNEVMKLAQSAKGANLKDETTVRNLVKKVSNVANRPISKEKEDKIVHAILTGKVPKDFSGLAKMMKKKN
ncbi:stage VI sporulation protein F [Bacillus sp. 2205SS5-2]|uniref:stage VI sporulation protein F n=1 Tax=Bacillus sp. 2205SS5-2 TaxID=3109031 RepID=UPI003006ED4D